MRNIHVSAPGSMMLFGEHAVVRSGLGIAMALAQRLHVKLSPRADRQITITSDRFPTWTGDIDNLNTVEPHDFALGVLRYWRNYYDHGWDIDIRSDLSATQGLGSSAALVVALTAALYESIQPKPANLNNLDAIAHAARQVIIQVQGRGSGCDAYASTFGAIVAVEGALAHAPQRLLSYQCVPAAPPIQAIYSGHKTKTPVVLAKVAAAETENPSLFSDIFKRINQQSKEALDALRKKNWHQLGILMQQQYLAQVALGVSDITIETIVKQLSQLNTCLGAKISGSGLGDCVIALGEIPIGLFPNDALPLVSTFSLQVDLQGVVIHKAKSKLHDNHHSKGNL